MAYCSEIKPLIFTKKQHISLNNVAYVRLFNQCKNEKNSYFKILSEVYVIHNKVLAVEGRLFFNKEKAVCEKKTAKERKE